MRAHTLKWVVGGLIFLGLERGPECLRVSRADPPAQGESSTDDVTRLTDVVYGRKYGTALTMDVFLPERGNRAGIIMVCSGAWVSSHSMIDAIRNRTLQPYLDRGYTIFAVLHGSGPRYTIPEILQDLNRSVRYLRSRAEDFHVDPDRIGIQGFSSGGHLALMQALAGDEGDPDAKDPVDRFASRVQAAVVGAPPTDFLNYGAPGEPAVGTGRLAGFHYAFAFTTFDPRTNAFLPVTDEQQIREIGRQISPASHVSADDPPILFIHGEADQAVPFQQSQSLIEKLEEVGVPTDLIAKPGVGHFWNDHDKDQPRQEEWFECWLLKK